MRNVAAALALLCPIANARAQVTLGREDVGQLQAIRQGAAGLKRTVDGARDSRAQAEVTVAALVEKLDSTEWTERAMALLQLAELGAEAKPALPRIIALLADKEEAVRAVAKSAAESLGSPDPRDAATKQALLKLLESKSDQVFEASAAALGTLKDKKIDLLVEAMRRKREAAKPPPPAPPPAKSHTLYRCSATGKYYYSSPGSIYTGGAFSITDDLKGRCEGSQQNAARADAKDACEAGAGFVGTMDGRQGTTSGRIEGCSPSCEALAEISEGEARRTQTPKCAKGIDAFREKLYLGRGS